MQKVSIARRAIILPAYNEETAIAETIRDFAAADPGAKIYVVDNASTDRTAEVARKALAGLPIPGEVLFEGRKGKANAVRKAFMEIEADVYIMADADSTYLAKDLQKLMAPVAEDRADIVVGNRHSDSVYRQQNTRPFHDFGNGLVRSLINALFKSSLGDIMSGYRVFNRRFVKNLPILSEGFEIETEMTLHAVDKRFRIVEVPIGYRARPEGSFSKLNTFRDGYRILKMIFWIFKDYRPLLFFSVLTSIFWVFGLGFGISVFLEFRQTGLVPRFPTAFLASGLMIFGLLFFAIGLILDTVAKFNREQFELRLLRYGSNDRVRD